MNPYSLIIISMQGNHFLKSFLFGVIFLSCVSSGFSTETGSSVSEADSITTNAASSITEKAEYSVVNTGNKSYHTFASPNLPETTVSTEYVDGKSVGNTITKTRRENGEIVVEVKDKSGKISIARSGVDGNFTGDPAAVTTAKDMKRALDGDKNIISQ